MISTLLEKLADAFLGVISFFANLSVSRYDDPSVAEYKRRQIACLVSTGILSIVCVVMYVVASGLDSVRSNSILSALVESVRGPLAYGFLAAVIGASGYALYSYYALWHFMKESGGFDQ